MRFHHVGISVKSLERSIEFYRDMLDMELTVKPFDLIADKGEGVEKVMGLKNVKVRQCYMTKGDVRLELFEFANPTPADQDPNYSVADRGISHFGFIVDDINLAYEHMHKAGVPFHSSVQTFSGGVKATYGRDPDGNVFELLEFPRKD
jgi:catechol 2,3-dioxygenase-like lactoylglutathione lyase family enzyme